MKYINFEEEPSAAVLDSRFMNEALKEAQKALEFNEVPIGAVIVHSGRVIGRGYNLTERLQDVTAHAEIQAFTAAADSVGGKYLRDCTLYVTLEPCVMCAGASYWTQISRIVFGATDDKRGFGRIDQCIIHPKTQILGGVNAQECGALLKDFFSKRRNKL
ncbi:MAG: nucleoside deaminase [Sphingobacteriaceae bacterium]|jgi:tRNA(adenine34) deaminase|nr:MAG: nucleoside deaminase [Pedobacter sp.]